MVFRDKPGYAYKVRVRNQAGDSVRLSTGTSDEQTAQAVKEMLVTFTRRRQWKILDLLVSKAASLPLVFDHFEQGTLDEYIAGLEQADLDEMLSEWERLGANKTYVRQVRLFIPKGEKFPADQFKRKAISKFLGELPVSGSTKNRHKAALSQFSKWLVERDVLESNIVRDVKGAKENPSRIVWYTWPEAKSLINVLPEPFKSLEALMAGTGLEWQAVMNLKRRDVNLDERTIEAHGSKNRWRERTVRVTEDWAWKIVKAHVQNILPNAPLFQFSDHTALDHHHKAVKAAHLKPSKLHDWRHTYAVNNLRDGVLPQVVKHQLGHAPNSTMVERIYGVWIVKAEDYGTAKSRAAR